MVTVAVQQIQPDPAAQQAANGGIPNRITQAIQTASARTGVNFAYLLNKAQQESSLDPNAKSASSSATGLFQFTGQTWLHSLKTHGAQYGLTDYADHITVDKDGFAHVKDPVWRNAILGLRKDPQVSAEMAGELDKDNTASLKSSIGGKIGPTELYLAHFLGAGGASDFIKTMRSSPNAPAASILPDAAEANSSVFYNSDGSARSVSQIYNHFAQKFDQSPSNIMVANANTLPASPATLAAQTYAMTQPAVTANANFSTPVSGFKPDGSSLFQTMILAQMNMGDSGMNSALSAAEHSHKSAISILGAVS